MTYGFFVGLGRIRQTIGWSSNVQLGEGRGVGVGSGVGGSVGAAVGTGGSVGFGRITIGRSVAAMLNVGVGVGDGSRESLGSGDPLSLGEEKVGDGRGVGIGGVVIGVSTPPTDGAGVT